MNFSFFKIQYIYAFFHLNDVKPKHLNFFESFTQLLFSIGIIKFHQYELYYNNDYTCLIINNIENNYNTFLKTLKAKHFLCLNISAYIF